MIPSRPSRTAERAAMRRAAHQLFDRPVVHDDPLALRMLAEADVAALRADPNAAADSRPLRAFLAVRSRVAEDALAGAVARGVRRYVLLGAGLDTFAYRNPHSDLRVFEVDHPDTQAMKRRRLADAGVALPDDVTYVAIDFATDALGPTLRAAGLAAPAFFAWLGVTPYLEADTVLATLDAVAPFTAGGGGIVFDYSVPATSLSPERRRAFAALSARVAAAGEPFRSAFEPSALRATLERIGFGTIDDLGPDELNARYFAGRTDGLAIMGGAHLVTAIG
jgi:methyltransferase (TIGR00027 family)